jgi:sRNA-binding protein
LPNLHRRRWRRRTRRQSRPLINLDIDAQRVDLARATVGNIRHAHVARFSTQRQRRNITRLQRQRRGRQRKLRPLARRPRLE